MCRLWIVAFLALAAVLPARAAEPMTVRLVQGSASCQPACNDWIAAEGEITPATPALFRKVLAGLGARKLPVVIHSPGGRLSAALEIGRMIRKQRLSVAVGQTRYLTNGDAEIISEEAICVSACPFVLAAGVERYAGEGAVVGVHQALMVRQGRAEARANAKASSLQLVKASAATARQFEAMRARLRSYLRDMGVSAALVDEMNKATPFEINVLSLDRQKQLGLVTSVTPLLRQASLSTKKQPIRVVVQPVAAEPVYTGTFEPMP